MISVCYIISGDLWAGAEVMARNLIRSLNSSEEVAVCAIVLNPGKLAQELEKAGIRIFVVDEAHASFMDILFRVRGILKITEPDIIHAHRYKENIIAFLAGGLSFTSRLISTQHGMPETDSQKSSRSKKIISWLNTFLLKYGFHSLICVSDDLGKNFTARYGMKSKKVGVIYNGMDIPEIMPTGRESRFVTIGSAGRFYPVKDFSFMIDIAGEVRRNNRCVKFRLAGDGPLRKELQDRAEACGLGECFEFAGHVDDMPSFYRSIDIYINTSVHEGVPMSILEAMSYGLPVVAPDVGGIGEMITHGHDGYLIRKRDPVEFAVKILELCKNKGLRKRVSAKAIETVRARFSAAKMAERYYNRYQELGVLK
jgi:glycosyltransferase involved in cell wall biosynthesis